MPDLLNTKAWRKAILRPVLMYAFFAALWILVSDRAVGWMVRDPDLLVRIGTLKGWVFVAVTSLLLYGLLARSWKQSIGELSAQIRALSLAEDALRESKDQFRRVVENSPLSMALVSSDGVIEYINLKAVETFGYLPQDIPNMDRWWMQAYPDKTYRGQVVAQWMGLVGEALAQNREIERREYRVTCKDGSVKIVAIFGVWIRDKVLVIFEDVTERQQAQEALRESDEKFAAAFNSAPVMITISGMESDTYLDVNRQFTVVSGFGPSEAIGKTSSELGWLDPKDRERLLELMRRESRVQDLELVLHPKSGEEVICRYWGERITVSGKECLLSVALDITGHRSIEQQFRQAQKMEAVGTLAGGIAHDFNNLLTVVLGNCEMIAKVAAPDSAVARCNGLIREAGERASSLVQQLLAFGRKQILRTQLLKLDEVVDDGLRMIGRLLREDVEISVRHSPDAGLIRVDPGQVQQILLNLALNARDAMPSGGKLTVETGSVHFDQTDVVLRPCLKPGRYEVLSVSDTGHGMDAPTQARIFEPFFTTKEFGRGSGLGLATVHGIVSQSGGHVEVVSKVGHGTTFRLYFPSTAHAIEGPSASPRFG